MFSNVIIFQVVFFLELVFPLRNEEIVEFFRRMTYLNFSLEVCEARAISAVLIQLFIRIRCFGEVAMPPVLDKTIKADS